MFCWTSESSPSASVDHSPNGYVARIGVMRRAHDLWADNDHRNGPQRLRDQITVWVDSDRWAASTIEG